MNGGCSWMIELLPKTLLTGKEEDVYQGMGIILAGFCRRMQRRGLLFIVLEPQDFLRILPPFFSYVCFAKKKDTVKLITTAQMKWVSHYD